MDPKFNRTYIHIYIFVYIQYVECESIHAYMIVDIYFTSKIIQPTIFSNTEVNTTFGLQSITQRPPPGSYSAVPFVQEISKTAESAIYWQGALDVSSCAQVGSTFMEAQLGPTRPQKIQH